MDDDDDSKEKRLGNPVFLTSLVLAVDAANVAKVRFQRGRRALQIHHGNGQSLHGQRAFGDGGGTLRHRRLRRIGDARRLLVLIRRLFRLAVGRTTTTQQLVLAIRLQSTFAGNDAERRRGARSDAAGRQGRGGSFRRGGERQLMRRAVTMTVMVVGAERDGQGFFLVDGQHVLLQITLDGKLFLTNVAGEFEGVVNGLTMLLQVALGGKVFVTLGTRYGQFVVNGLLMLFEIALGGEIFAAVGHVAEEGDGAALVDVHVVLLEIALGDEVLFADVTSVRLGVVHHFQVLFQVALGDEGLFADIADGFALENEGAVGGHGRLDQGAGVGLRGKGGERVAVGESQVVLLVLVRGGEFVAIEVRRVAIGGRVEVGWWGWMMRRI